MVHKHNDIYLLLEYSDIEYKVSQIGCMDILNQFGKKMVENFELVCSLFGFSKNILSPFSKNIYKKYSRIIKKNKFDQFIQ